jgi:hypothetical protein
MMFLKAYFHQSEKQDSKKEEEKDIMISME